MKQISILEWEDASVGYTSPMLLRLPYQDIENLDEYGHLLLKKWGPLHGIIPPYSHDNIEFNIRCAARILDRFTDVAVNIYVAVPSFKTYERIKTIYGAGFRNIVVPKHLGKVEYDHYFQFIPNETLDNLTLHVAGGEFSSPTWNRENWTWSKERL